MKSIIELSKLSEEGLVIDNSDDFRNSIFNAVYQKVELILADIVSKNGHLKQEREKIFIEKNEKNTQYDEINNIVSFVGSRGTGKTSAMLSIRKALQIYEGDNVSFMVLDYIDASTLESKENVVDMILSEMFLELRNFDDRVDCYFRSEYSNKELYDQFSKVYSTVLTLANQEENPRGFSSLRMLNEASNSHALKKSLGKLVDKYLEYMSSAAGNNQCNKKRFLVISIDDLDMRFGGDDESPYEMLEMLHRYLMLPNVIILLTYNYEDLALACEKHFNRIYPKNNTVSSRRVKKLTVEYLNKIVPIYSRVYMPSMQKRDYADTNELRIVIKKDDNPKDVKIFENNFSNDKNVLDMSVKKFALLLKSNVVGLYYDAKGKKRHFSEPSSLRELTQLYQFFKHIDLLKEQNLYEEDMCFKQLLDDLYFRFATEKLTEDELNDFNNYLNVSIERRSRDIVNNINELYNEKFPSSEVENEKKNLSEITYIGKKYSSYSYGELLFFLYNASHKKLFSKEFIWCFLESYTTILTHIYRKITMSDKGDICVIKKNKKLLLDIIGASISSSWSNMIVPKFQRSRIIDSNDELDQASEHRVIEHEHSSLVAAAAVKYSISSTLFRFAVQSTLRKEDLIQDFRMFEILGMFFTNVYYRGSNADIDKGFQIKYIGSNAHSDMHYRELINSGEEQLMIRTDYDIEFNFSDSCFNIMNFVVNLLSWDEYFEQFHNNLKEAYSQYFIDLKRIECNRGLGEILDDVDTFFAENSLRNKYQKWFDTYNGFAMPIYSFDMMYNILKRQYQNQGAIPVAVQPHVYWSYIMKAYERIGVLLKEEEDFYFNTNTDSNTNNLFYHAYRECPFIDYVISLEKEENIQLKEKFEKRFCDMLTSIVVGGK